jgi:hypothetical protein
MALLAFTTRSIWFLKLCFIVDMFVPFEAGLFIALLVRRVSSNSKLRLRCLMSGSCVFLASNIPQGLLLVYFIAGSAARMKAAGPWSFGLFVFGTFGASIFVLLHLHTLAIFRSLIRAEQRKANATPSMAPVQIETPCSVDSSGSQDWVVDSTRSLDKGPAGSRLSVDKENPSGCDSSLVFQQEAKGAWTFSTAKEVVGTCHPPGPHP